MLEREFRPWSPRVTRARAPLFPAYLVSEHVASNGHSHLHKHDERQEDGELQKHRAGVGFDVWI